MARTRFLCSLAFRVQGLRQLSGLRNYATRATDASSLNSASPSSMIARHFPSRRWYAATPMRQDEVNEIIEDINSKFAEAREEIELAAESKETVYFNEEAETAKKAVAEVLEIFNGLLARLPEAERGAIQRSMGMKMEQLKAEVAQLDEH